MDYPPQECRSAVADAVAVAVAASESAAAAGMVADSGNSCIAAVDLNMISTVGKYKAFHHILGRRPLHPPWIHPCYSSYLFEVCYL